MKRLLLVLLLLPLGLMAQFRPTYQIKTDGDNAFYQDVVQAEGIGKDELFERAKSFVASNIISKTIQSNHEDKAAGKLIFAEVQNLFAPQGLGSVPFEVAYSVTIEVKDGRYRYTVDNIEFAYNALMTGAGKRNTLYKEYSTMMTEQGNGLASRRILVFDAFLMNKIEELKNTVAKSSLTKSDF